MKQNFSVEHLLTECLISGYITNYIEDKATMATGKQVAFNPLSTLLNIPDEGVNRVIKDNKTRNQIISWHQAAITRAWNIYHTIEFRPSENIVIELIKEALEEVKIIVTKDGGRMKWLKNIKTYNREAKTKSLEERICKLNKCHYDNKDHQISRIFENQNERTQQYEEEIDPIEIKMMRTICQSNEFVNKTFLNEAISEINKRSNYTFNVALNDLCEV